MKQIDNEQYTVHLVVGMIGELGEKGESVEKVIRNSTTCVRTIKEKQRLLIFFPQSKEPLTQNKPLFEGLTVGASTSLENKMTQKIKPFFSYLQIRQIPIQHGGYK